MVTNIEVMKFYKSIYKEIEIPVSVGSEILHGKFRNRKAIFKGVDSDEKGNIILKTSAGDKKIPFRVPELVR